jgi:hypothetical protein
VENETDGLPQCELPKADGWIAWAGNSTTAITEEDVDLTCPDAKETVLKFANELYSILMSCTEEATSRMKAGSGLEAT